MASEGVILEGKDRGDTKNYGSNRKKQKWKSLWKKVGSFTGEKKKGNNKGIKCLESPAVLPSSAAAAVVVQTNCFCTHSLGEGSEEELLLGNQRNTKCFSWY
jgi:hypothetical protein